ncbi:MAG: hypothetical protein ACXWK7_17640 [Caulobacteraceae bacterium]
MDISRRKLLAASSAAAAAAPVTAFAQSAPAPAPIRERLAARARENTHALGFDGKAFGGPAWDLILKEGGSSEFVLLGEEHGTAEIPVFAQALFLALRPAGFDTLGIEISPPIAQDLDRAALGGVAGIADFIRAWPPGPAFYFWRTEAELIAAVRAAVPRGREALWGLDYEVTGDRRLIARLKAKAPPSARAALGALEAASTQAWSTWAGTHNPGQLFTFSGDPALVRAVRAAWPKPDADAARILTTLEETLEINRLYPGQGWASNERRAKLMRANLVAHLTAAAAQGRRPRVLFKMGETHMMRGPSTTGNFDVGSLIAEAAELRGGKSFSIIAGAGPKSRHGILNPSNMSVADAPADMLDDFMGLGFLTAPTVDRGPVLIDLRPLRPLLGSPTRIAELANSEAVRAIFAFDTLLVWNGATGARMLVS